MKDIQLSEDVLPIGEFKKHASRLFRRLRESGQPIVVTQHGSPVGVVISAEEYDQLRERERFIAAVEQGLRQAEAGQTLSSEQVDKELDYALGLMKKLQLRSKSKTKATT